MLGQLQKCMPYGEQVIMAWLWETRREGREVGNIMSCGVGAYVCGSSDTICILWQKKRDKHECM